MRLGRHPDNDVVFTALEDRTVSGHHCELFFSAETFHLRDLASANGTYIGSERIQTPTSLRSGDELRLRQEGPVLSITIGADLGGTARFETFDSAAQGPAAASPKPPARTFRAKLTFVCLITGLFFALVYRFFLR